MYKIVIVDDEYLVRTGIRETIGWESLGFEIAGEAANGREGLELIKRVKPDIVITDIKMPLMDGQQLAKEVSEACDCAVIILSGYKSFEYVRDTFENGVYAYLLKPVDNDELIRTVLITLEKLLKRRSDQTFISEAMGDITTLQNKLLLDILEDGLTDEDAAVKKLTLYGLPVIRKGIVVYAGADGFADNPADIRLHESLRILFGLCRDAFDGACCGLFNGFLALILPETDVREAEKSIKAVLKEYEKASPEIVSFGVGAHFKALPEIKAAFHSAKNAAAKKLFPAINSVTVQDGAGGGYHPDVLRGMQYIAKNYGKNINIRQVAESLYVSESHLMHLFKDSAGKTFNECLTDYRILIAKKLLSGGGFKIYEVAEMAGYPDVKYFTQVFKKQTGLTPTEYAEKAGGGR